MFLSPTVRLWSICIFVSLTGCLFGGDTGSIGSITSMSQFEDHFGKLSEFMKGLVVSVILIPSAVTGIAGGSVSDKISRKYTICLGSSLFALGSALSCYGPSLAVLIVARCIAGAGEGLFLSAATVYLCEICPKNMRGRALSCFSAFLSGAIALGFFVCYGTIRLQSSLAWRIPFAISTAVSLLIAAASPFLPYSPRWLVSQGRREEAIQTLDLVTDTRHEQERKDMLAVLPERGNWSDIFSKGVRGRTFLGAFLNVVQQLSGIDFVLFYAPLLFAQAGLDPNTSSFVASGVTGLLIFTMSLLGTYYVDKIGRRTLIIYGGIAISLCHLTIASLYASGGAHQRIGKWVVIVAIELFAISFSGTWSLAVRLYTAEIQPNRTRSAANSFGQGANQFANTIVALTSPAFLAKSAYGPYFLYGSFMAIGTLVAYIYMPETIGKSLENIDTSFDDSPYAATWPRVLKPTADRLRLRRPSRRRSSAHATEAGQPTFPGTTGFQRLNSSALVGSAIEEEEEADVIELRERPVVAA